MWEIFRCFPLSVSDYTKPASCVRTSVWTQHVHTFYSVLPHNKGYRILCDLSFLITQYEGQVFPAFESYTLSLLTRKKVPSQRYPIPLPTLFIPSALPTPSIHRCKKVRSEEVNTQPKTTKLIISADSCPH